jgi:hypothetical protein
VPPPGNAALYRDHQETPEKDAGNLIAQAWSEIALPDLSAAGWRAAATAMATGEHAMLTRHGWMVQAFGSQVLYGPGKARHDDHSLAIYEAAGFTPEQADQATAAVFTFVLGSVLGPAAAASLTRKLSRDGGDAGQQIRAGMAEAAAVAAQFPRLRARLGTTSAGYAASPDNTFELGLQPSSTAWRPSSPCAAPEIRTRPGHPAACTPGRGGRLAGRHRVG